jgi:hypothetical protein
MGASYFGIKVLNQLPPSLKILSNDLKQFRPALQQFLLPHSVHSRDEYFNVHLTKDPGPYILYKFCYSLVIIYK